MKPNDITTELLYEDYSAFFPDDIVKCVKDLMLRMNKLDKRGKPKSEDFLNRMGNLKCMVISLLLSEVAWESDEALRALKEYLQAQYSAYITVIAEEYRDVIRIIKTEAKAPVESRQGTKLPDDLNLDTVKPSPSSDERARSKELQLKDSVEINMLLASAPTNLAAKKRFEIYTKNNYENDKPIGHPKMRRIEYEVSGRHPNWTTTYFRIAEVAHLNRQREDLLKILDEYQKHLTDQQAQELDASQKIQIVGEMIGMLKMSDQLSSVKSRLLAVQKKFNDSLLTLSTNNDSFGLKILKMIARIFNHPSLGEACFWKPKAVEYAERTSIIIERPCNRFG